MDSNTAVGRGLGFGAQGAGGVAIQGSGFGIQDTPVMPTIPLWYGRRWVLPRDTE